VESCCASVVNLWQIDSSKLVAAVVVAIVVEWMKVTKDSSEDFAMAVPNQNEN
jgi:hypothetical protein